MGKLIVFVLLLIICNISVISSEDVFEDDYSEYNENVYRKYVKMDMQLKQIAERSVKKLLPYLLEAREHVNISASCTQNLFDLVNGFRKLTNWSLNCKYLYLFFC